MAVRSLNGYLAEQAGYTRGTKDYDNYMRRLQRATTEAGQRRAATAATLSKLTPEQAGRIQARNTQRNVIPAGVSGVGQRVKMYAKINIGHSAADQRRSDTPRYVTSQHHLTKDTAELLRDDPVRFWQLEFSGDLDGFDYDDYDAGDTDSDYGPHSLEIYGIWFV